MNTDEIRSLINRRRRQILVHSIIYYRLDDSLVSDSQWAKWAIELKQLQDKYPDIAAQCCYADAFRDFDPSTGYNLPLYDTNAVAIAQRLLEYKHRMEM